MSPKCHDGEHMSDAHPRARAASASGAAGIHKKATTTTTTPKARTWPCQHCGEAFTANEAIRVRSGHGYLLPIHKCMLSDVEFWYDVHVGAYVLVTPNNIRPGRARVWWGCYDASKMTDDACVELET